ncbi:hypothetical protein AMJ86_08685 [bacterium SM23_57]|nr:MAG: hypothetical protein AMJ86_08685 [bacterium SM23_57]
MIAATPVELISGMGSENQIGVRLVNPSSRPLGSKSHILRAAKPIQDSTKPASHPIQVIPTASNVKRQISHRLP